MQSFKDSTGRAWNLSIDVGAVKRIRDLLKVDLMDAISDSGRLLMKLDGDPCLLVDIIYVLCKPEADAANITDEDFGRAMIGDVIDSATAAFLEELANFFPGRRRTLLKKAVSKVNQAQNMAADRAEKALDEMDLEKVLDNVTNLALTGGTSSLNAQES